MANWPNYEDYLRGRIYLNNDPGYTRIVSNIDRQKVFAGYHWHQLDVLIGRPETTNISDYYKILNNKQQFKQTILNLFL